MISVDLNAELDDLQARMGAGDEEAVLDSQGRRCAFQKQMLAAQCELGIEPEGMPGVEFDDSMDALMQRFAHGDAVQAARAAEVELERLGSRGAEQAQREQFRLQVPSHTPCCFPLPRANILLITVARYFRGAWALLVLLWRGVFAGFLERRPTCLPASGAGGPLDVL